MGKTKKKLGVDAGHNCDTAAPCSGLSWCSATADGVIVAVHAQPGARRDAVVGLYDGRLKIALSAPPVDGRANAALAQFLAHSTGVAKSAVELVSGQTSRAKRFLIRGVTLEAVIAALEPQ